MRITDRIRVLLMLIDKRGVDEYGVDFVGGGSLQSYSINDEGTAPERCNVALVSNRSGTLCARHSCDILRVTISRLVQRSCTTRSASRISSIEQATCCGI